VYALASPGGQLTTNMCSGTKLAADGAADLAFLEQVTGPPRGVRVFGHVRRVEDDLVSHRRDYGGVAGARVNVTGEQTSREGTTGADGNFDFPDLAPGTYTVTVTPPKGLALAGPPLPQGQHHPPGRKVTLTNPSECAEIWSWPRTDAQISGVLLNSNGGPEDDQSIDLIAASNATLVAKQIPHVSTRTGSDGRFTFAFLAPGEYLVGMNLKSAPEPSQLDHRSYHPGVMDVVRATRVTVEPGSRVRLAPFTVPELPRERRIFGIVVWSDGAPAPAATLMITGARPEPVPLDSSARFSIVLPYGARFSFIAEATQLVDGRRVVVKSPVRWINRNDRDADVNLVLGATK
jgi:hypothetical protein